MVQFSDMYVYFTRWMLATTDRDLVFLHKIALVFVITSPSALRGSWNIWHLQDFDSGTCSE